MNMGYRSILHKMKLSSGAVEELRSIASGPFHSKNARSIPISRLRSFEQRGLVGDVGPSHMMYRYTSNGENVRHVALTRAGWTVLWALEMGLSNSLAAGGES